MQIKGSVRTYLEVFILNGHLQSFETITIQGYALTKNDRILIKNKFFFQRDTPS